MDIMRRVGWEDKEELRRGGKEFKGEGRKVNIRFSRREM
jgi:hypothetical protein